MEIKYEKTQFHNFKFVFPYSKEVINYCQFLSKSYGWKNFNFNQGAWRFRDPALAALIQLRYPQTVLDPVVKSMVITADKENKEAIEIEKRAEIIKNSFESDLDTTGIKGEPYPYQKVGMEFFLNNKGRAILSDEMGTGKTMQSLGYVVLSKSKRTLVICPASVKFSWRMEVKKWTSLKSFVVGPKTLCSEIPSDTDIVIINYDILKKHKEWLTVVKWDCVICDEAQYIKERTALRSKMVKEITKKVPSIIMLSGTPMMSRPIELFNLLTIIDSKTWNNYYEYGKEYCDGKKGYWGWEFKGATNLDKLSKKISRYFLRRTKDQVLKFLPPKNNISMPVELSPQYEADYFKASQKFAKFLKENKGKKDREVLKTLQAEKLVKINYLREISAMGKLEAAKELIKTITENGEKVLVFSSFVTPLKELADEFQDSVIICGEVDAEERGEIVKKFQTNPDTNVFLGGYLSAGTGITLTAASNVILLDLPWRPGDKNQAIDRCHRPGVNAESINIYQLHTPGTIDDFMEKLLKRKQKVFNEVIDTQNAGAEVDLGEELIKLIEESNQKYDGR